MVIAYLLILGLCLGSFVNALVWRLKNKKDWVKSRSQCPNCKHQLSVSDLIPVFSWLALRGRCRYCHKLISAQYPIVELATALVFAASYIYWPHTLAGGQIILFITWLICAVGLMALLVYDLKWMLLPNTIIYPTLLVAIAGNLVFLIGYEPHKLHALVMWALSVLAASGIFWALFMVSKGKWIGYGDVRLGWITGTLLQTPTKSLLMIFLASILGTLTIMPLIASGKHKLSAKIPYGPFLIAATFICVLFGGSFIDWYSQLFLP